jgi:adenylate kinase
MPGWVALTGTPGTGKTTIAERLKDRWPAVEVADLAVRTKTGRRLRDGDVEVDMERLSDWIKRESARDGPTVVVGHLAHLLPVRDAILLRCHPIELERRLARARRGDADERRQNAAAEATDLILREAVDLRRRIWEVDTTGRTVADVAREVEGRIRHRGAARYATVAWLTDPTVTEYLMNGHS